MASVILMGRRTEHQNVYSTYRSRTKPTAQTKAAIRAANVTTFNDTNYSNIIRQTNYNAAAKGL